ncbi:MAG: sigma-70 family RNA polymerase sigma factor [Oscillospiraceae bacterium]
MAFNKAKEERKWLNWKEAEEKQMRELGVSEDVIERIRKSDWTTFKAERCYYEKVISTDYIEYFSQQEYKKEYKTLEDFLNDIENQELYFILLSIDKISLNIIFYKIQGYSVHEIARILDLTENAIYKRIQHLKEKIKKVL